MKAIIKIGLFLVLCVYVLILSKLVLFKYLSLHEILAHFAFRYEGPTWNEHNLIPFKTIFFYLFSTDINFSIRVENLVGNIIGFAPFGFLLPSIWRKFQNLTNIVLATLCLSFMFEFVQLSFKFGSFDVDDLLLNTLGGVIGYLPFLLFNTLIKNKQQHRLVNRRGFK
ncbi:VanZ family protein [Virgibacillus dokdonensis]|nr:VanZ family protein [Virgibacillus sp.]